MMVDVGDADDVEDVSWAVGVGALWTGAAWFDAAETVVRDVAVVGDVTAGLRAAAATLLPAERPMLLVDGGRVEVRAAVPVPVPVAPGAMDVRRAAPVVERFFSSSEADVLARWAVLVDEAVGGRRMEEVMPAAGREGGLLRLEMLEREVAVVLEVPVVA